MLIFAAPVVASPSPAKGQGTTDGNTRSPHGPLALPCQNCHTSVAWKPIRAIPEFDHNKTRYPLRGMHQNVACVQCHTKPVFTNVGTRCADCHADIHRGQFGASCDQCHSVKGWDVNMQSVRNHDNRFPLVGAHAQLDCESCHKSAAVGQFVGLSTACYSCHAQVYLQAKNPNHVALQFATTCDSCHGMDTWFDVSRFNHNATGFPLTGFHATMTCVQCHANNNFNITSSACYQAGCHVNDYNNTNNPSHVSLRFATDCTQCHTTVAWVPANFNHNTTNFPLTGAHASTPCGSCHTNNNYNITNTTCVSCHLNDFTKAVSPVNHSGFDPNICQTCHDTVTWTDGKFDHSQPPANWALTGAHANVACASCHTTANGGYNISSTACALCHMTDFKNAVSPVNHAGFDPNACQTCHNTVSWQQATFDHATSGFPLTGAHATLQCAQCHVNNNYSIPSGACYQANCHVNDYNNAVSPVNHVQGGFPTTCQTCHDMVAWTDATFNHANPPANWALTGAHAALQCAQCHVNNNYNLTSTTCYQANCHINDFANAVSPVNHAGFPTACQQCHDTVAWTDATFNHANPPANWALVGAHATLQCAQCHVNNNYNLTSTTCYQANCHINDYTNAVSPINHVQLGFPTTCQQCHDTVAWTDATFNHANPPANWALTGAHATLTCVQCHVGNNYSIASTACYQANCHINDYNNAVSPMNHKALGFPTTCEGCHDTVNWMDGTFNHATTGFTLIGTHATLACTQCHGANNATTFSSGTCYQAGCHITDYQNAVSPINHVQLGFPTTCETCHADEVAWTNATFNHANAPANWALQGMHATTPCASCHVNNNYAITSTDCYSCHKADFTGTTSPNHVSAGFPTTCVTCHTTWTTTNWLGATFNHTWFPTSHGNAGGVCATCHTNSSNYAIFQCTGCHGNNNSASFSHPKVNGYVYNSTNCYQCHPNGSGG